MSEEELKPVEAAPETTDAAPATTADEPAPAAAAPAAAAEPASNEPAEPAAKSEAAPASAEGQPIGGLIYTILMVLVFIFVVIGTPISWAELKNSTVQSAIHLWKVVVTTSSGTTTYYPGDDTVYCAELTQHTRAAAAFSIISIFLALVSVVIGAAINKGAPKILGTVVALATSLATLITWAIAVRVYYKEMCGRASLDDQHGHITGGVALFVISWVLSIIAAIVAFVDPKAPTGERGLKIAEYLFVFFLASAFVFTVIGCPTNQYFYSESGKATEVTLWKYVSKEDGQPTETTYFSKLDGCDDIKQMFQAAEAFSIISIVVALAAAVAGYLSLTKGELRKLAIALGFLTAALTLITWGLSAKIYYGSWCLGNIAFESSNFIFSAGFALYVSAFVFALTGTILLTLLQLVGKAQSDSPIKPVALVFAFGIAVSLLFYVVGCAVAQQTLEGSTSYDVTFWHIKSDDHAGTITYMPISDFCKKRADYVHTAAAFDIIACVILFAALLLSIVQITKDEMRVPAAAVGIVASVFQLISWAISLAVLWQNTCDGSLHDSGAKIGPGLALLITGWCITLVVSALNFVVA